MQSHIIDRFWAKVDKNGPLWDGNRCWLWTAAQDGRGYGHLRLEGRTRKAHRLAYEWLVGPIPSGLEIDHLCQRPLCVNPQHLELVPHSQNVRRGNSGARNRAKTHCPRGHSYDGPDMRINIAGSRYCLACMRTGPRKPTLSCPQGHPFVAENTYVRPDGYKECRTCRKYRQSSRNDPCTFKPGQTRLCLIRALAPVARERAQVVGVSRGTATLR